MNEESGALAKRLGEHLAEATRDGIVFAINSARGMAKAIEAGQVSPMTGQQALEAFANLLIEVMEKNAR